jgi:hypothetical protein
MDITRFEIELTRHALMRADERGITPDLYMAVLKGGSVKRSGKHIVRFSKDYKKFRIICIGTVFPGRIDIITIECAKNEKMR